MTDITEPLKAARNALTRGRAADCTAWRRRLEREAGDPLVLEVQRGEASALAAQLAERERAGDLVLGPFGCSTTG